jgi:hypothetical protein
MKAAAAQHIVADHVVTLLRSTAGDASASKLGHRIRPLTDIVVVTGPLDK